MHFSIRHRFLYLRNAVENIVIDLILIPINGGLKIVYCKRNAFEIEIYESFVD